MKKLILVYISTINKGFVTYLVRHYALRDTNYLSTSTFPINVR